MSNNRVHIRVALTDVKTYCQLSILGTVAYDVFWDETSHLSVLEQKHLVLTVSLYNHCHILPFYLERSRNIPPLSMQLKPVRRASLMGH